VALKFGGSVFFLLRGRLGESARKDPFGAALVWPRKDEEKALPLPEEMRGTYLVLVLCVPASVEGPGLWLPET